MKKKIFLILYPFKFRNFDEKRFELDLLKKKHDVIIFEFINILFPHFKKAYNKEKKIVNLFQINSLYIFFFEFKKLSKLNQDIIILDFLKADSFKTLLIKIYLKFSSKKKVGIFNPGTSLFNNKIFKTNSNQFQKILSYFKKPLQTLYKIKTKFLKILFNCFNIQDDYVFLSGSECLKEYIRNKKIKIVKGHSWDISQIYSRKTKKIFKKKYAVYIDAPGPKFYSDSFLFKVKSYETSNHTYPLLKSFFDYIEKKLNLKVVIAPHPKTKIKDRSKLFGFRRVINGKTNDLIKHSSFIITRNSSAVAFACYYRKPIILFYTNQTQNTEAQKSTDSLSKSLGLEAVNLDNYQKINFRKIMKFEKKKI